MRALLLYTRIGVATARRRDEPKLARHNQLPDRHILRDPRLRLLCVESVPSLIDTSRHPHSTKLLPARAIFSCCGEGKKRGKGGEKGEREKGRRGKGGEKGGKRKRKKRGGESR